MSFPNSGKVLFTATLVRGHIAKFHLPYLKWFKEQGWETWVAAKNDYMENTCNIPYCDHYVDVDFARTPFSARTLSAYRQLHQLFDQEKFDIVHTHTPVGGVLTRLAARSARAGGTSVIYTAHGFHFYDGAPPINWLLWYPVERIMSCFTDVLITINDEDYRRARRFAHCEVEYIPGVGVDLSRFAASECRNRKRAELGLDGNSFALLSVGDLIPRKNQVAIIEAMAQLPKNVKLNICGYGPEEEKLRRTARELGVCDRVALRGFRDDIDEIMAASDALVFPSVHEGLPVTVMEAMASGLPVIAGAIRGIYPDLLRGHESGIVLEAIDGPSIANSVRELMADAKLGSELARRAHDSVKHFSLEESLSAMEKIYLREGALELDALQLQI